MLLCPLWCLQSGEDKAPWISPRCSSALTNALLAAGAALLHVPRLRRGEAATDRLDTQKYVVEEHAAKAVERLDAVRCFGGPIKILRRDVRDEATWPEGKDRKRDDASVQS